MAVLADYDTLTFAAIEGSHDCDIAAAVLKQAYAELGIEIRIEPLAGRGSLISANSGKLDGELQRIDGISRDYTNLIQVNVPLNYIDGVVLTLDTNLTVSGWPDLRPLKIGLVSGILFAENGTRGMNTRKVDSYSDLFLSLRSGLVDVAVVPRINAVVELARDDSTAIQLAPGVLESFLLYHYLHEKHLQLVPFLEDVLKEMLVSGKTQQIRRYVIDQLIAGLGV